MRDVASAFQSSKGQTRHQGLKARFRRQQASFPLKGILQSTRIGIVPLLSMSRMLHVVQAVRSVSCSLVLCAAWIVGVTSKLIFPWRAAG